MNDSTSESIRETVDAGESAASIRPFRVQIPQAEINDLHARLNRARWSGELPGSAWDRGVPGSYIYDLAHYWLTTYDWRRHERYFNQFSQYMTEVDDTRIHFLHIRSSEPAAMPLLLIHGWPGSVVEFLEVIGPLTEPSANGSPGSPAFHVVVPSLPGHCLSGSIHQPGWTHVRIAKAFGELMARLGYHRYGIQGGDSGAFIAPDIARLHPERVAGVHVNALVTFPSGDPTEFDGLTEADKARIARLEHYKEEMMGYAHIQGTRPQTISYGLTDSPIGQLAWIVEKFKEWTDPATHYAEDPLNRDIILTNTSLYWFTCTAGSSANLYYENLHQPNAWGPKPRGTVPTGVLVSLTRDVAVRRFAEREHNITHWSESSIGGHFFALEQPFLFVQDVRTFFSSLEWSAR
jgi:pimeloyl-ACP methyl ester carboxylesterase